MSKLLTIDGIGPGELELLEAAGWSDLRSLAAAEPVKLTEELAKANSMLRIVQRTPDVRIVSGWVSQARELMNGGTPAAQPRKRVQVSRKAPAEESPAPVASPRPRPKAKPPAAPTQPDLFSQPAAAAVPTPAPAPVVYDEEEALARVSGPVNFEADPEVLTLLLRAPVAVPIPARMLAEKGIAPSEIAVAPLLNRALGDLEVRVAASSMPEPAPVEVAEEPEEDEQEPAAPVAAADAKPAMPSAAREPRVSASSLHQPEAAGRRGIDTARVRTIEEFQAEAPAVRPSSSKAGMEDSRIALLRSPLPGTNGNRKPSSRFYIRGVLHDRPYKVWFGGLIAVLLQIDLPLGLIAAPLLILKEQKVPHFEWVQDWIVAFPIALPILFLLYGMVSSGCKCRVCGQRIYMPKNCLKNRKAHKAFYFGHIGALAFHVMIFKWFNCTFCGTSIRIKK